MGGGLYNQIILETLIPESLPGVSLFMKHGTNYTLYKGPDLPFTERDKQRLVNGQIEYLFVFSSDLSDYNLYVESNLSELLENEDFSLGKRQEILCQASVSYVQEIFDAPAMNIKSNLDRCKSLIKHILSDHFSPHQLMSTLGSLVSHNSYTYVHSVQVSSYMTALYKLRNTEDEILMDVGIGGIFHDYGKVYVPQMILDKPDKLTSSEFEEIKGHPKLGHDALDQLGILNPIALDIVRHHHEKFNGTGYPDGLTEISRYAKIASIADVYSALTTNRSYRQALTKEVALDIMSDQMKGSFDTYYLSMFSAMLE
ncbi:MAG: HD domain-containing protein [Desulfuromonadaceae bacterium]|nr:HD domain-containing protein [Desulfuromonadaceae bacterium]